jgi:hypothetical protein
VNEYRITKYNPAYRDAKGAYTADEWIRFQDVGRSFAGVILTTEEYARTEDAYAKAALAFLTEAGLSALNVNGLENRTKQPLSFHEGSTLALNEIGDVIRRVLREEFWCRLEGAAGFIHIGWDYYMYLGVPHPCPEARASAVEMGLYVEDFASPYRDQTLSRDKSDLSEN